MIPVIFRGEIPRPNACSVAKSRTPPQSASIESAAVIGFISAVAAYGAFFIPKAYGTSLALTGNAGPALYGFIVFYVLCIALTWFFYAAAMRSPC